VAAHDRAAVRVRPARLEDHDAVGRLRRELANVHARIQPGFFQGGPGEGEAASHVDLAWLRQVLGGADGHDAVLVAERDRSVVGFVQVGLRDAPADPELSRARRVHVEALAVARGVRRVGVGRRLMEEAEAWGRARGALEVVLTVWAGNRAAERFYRALGYATVSRVLGRAIA
jgi:ribosomal protein S18 acetylase RimI-like enzyme